MIIFFTVQQDCCYTFWIICVEYLFSCTEGALHQLGVYSSLDLAMSSPVRLLTDFYIATNTKNTILGIQRKTENKMWHRWEQTLMKM